MLISFGMKELDVIKTQEEGSFWASFQDSKGNAQKVFVTKATNIKEINGDTPVTLIDGKFYIGITKLKVLDRATIKV